MNILGEKEVAVTAANISPESNFTLCKNDVFWDITPCGSCKNQRFGGT
jgi:hypothetical protein